MRQNEGMTKVAFLGLGVMGFPMAGHLVARGFDVRAWNRSPAKRARFAEAHPTATVAETIADAVRDVELVFMCVGNDDDVRSVAYGADGVVGAITAMPTGAVLVDHTTASADLARELSAACRARGLSFVDAPVSGGQIGAENGQLTIMCGGDTSAFARAEAVLASYAKRCLLMGPAGSGQLTKMVNQICVAGVVQSLAEGMRFAANAGLDVQRVIDVISQGAASSWQMVNRHEAMIAGRYDYGFAVDWMRKDLAIVLAEAERNGSSVELTALVDRFYADVQAMGGGRWDTSSLLARLEAKDPSARARRD